MYYIGRKILPHIVEHTEWDIYIYIGCNFIVHISSGMPSYQSKYMITTSKGEIPWPPTNIWSGQKSGWRMHRKKVITIVCWDKDHRKAMYEEFIPKHPCCRIGRNSRKLKKNMNLIFNCLKSCHNHLF